MANSQPFYADDLAYIHDVGFSTLLEGFTPGLLETLRNAGIQDGPIIDLGCGGGRWVEHLVNAGYRAAGVDVSPAMIKLARRRVPSASFQVGSVWGCSIPRCQAVTAFRKLGQTYRRSQERHAVQLYDGSEVADKLRATGFRVRRVRQIDSHPLLPKRLGFIARKPESS